MSFSKWHQNAARSSDDQSSFKFQIPLITFRAKVSSIAHCKKTNIFYVLNFGSWCRFLLSLFSESLPWRNDDLMTKRASWNFWGDHCFSSHLIIAHKMPWFSAVILLKDAWELLSVLCWRKRTNSLTWGLRGTERGAKWPQFDAI